MEYSESMFHNLNLLHCSFAVPPSKRGTTNLLRPYFASDGAPDCCFAGTVIATVRLVGFRYFCATRCTSVLVTAADFSNCVLIRLGLMKKTAYSLRRIAVPSELCSDWIEPRRAKFLAFSSS